MARGSALLIIERILRDRDGIWHQIAKERDLGGLISSMLASSALAFAAFGAVLGASSGPIQALSSAVKLPLLFLMTLAICLPTLYLFNLVFGARLQVRQALALVLVTITVTAVLSLAFAPISLFFLITTDNYSFYKLLNVGILALSALVGLKFLTAGMTALNAETAAAAAVVRAAEQAAALREAEARQRVVTAAQTRAETPGAGDAVITAPVPAEAQVPAPAMAGQVAAVPAGSAPGQVAHLAAQPNGGHQAVPAGPPAQPGPPGHPMLQQPQFPTVRTLPGHPALPGERPASMTLLYVWIMLFGFVGTQLAWTLRPFVGYPGMDFEIFRNIDGNFYVDIVRTLGALF